MRVFTYFDSSADAPEYQAALVRVWEMSWRRRGWEPKLLTALNARRSRFYREHDEGDPQAMAILAFQASGCGWYADLSVINFDWKPNRPKGLRMWSPAFFYIPKRRLANCLPWQRHANNGRFPEVMKHLETGWERCPVVQFEGVTDPDTITDCGRSL